VKIRVCFFASIRELVGESEIYLELDNGSDTEELQATLKQNLGGERWNILQNNLYKMSINQSLIESTQKLNDGDEVAFLPRMTGG